MGNEGSASTIPKDCTQTGQQTTVTEGAKADGWTIKNVLVETGTYLGSLWGIGKPIVMMNKYLNIFLIIQVS